MKTERWRRRSTPKKRRQSFRWFSMKHCTVFGGSSASKPLTKTFKTSFHRIYIQEWVLCERCAFAKCEYSTCLRLMWHSNNVYKPDERYEFFQFEKNTCASRMAYKFQGFALNRRTTSNRLFRMNIIEIVTLFSLPLQSLRGLLWIFFIHCIFRN